MVRRLTFLAAAMAASFLASPASAYMVYVSNEKDNTVTVVDSTTMEVVKTINVGQRPRGITISHDGKFIYLCASDDDTIEIIDTATHEIVGSLPSGPDPELFVLSPDGKTLYVANEDDNLVTVIDLESKKVLAEVPVGVEPEGMGISPDGKTMVNTSETTNMAHFIDTSSHEITDNVLVDSRPRFAEFKPDDSEVWVSAEIGGTVSVIDNATPGGEAQDHLRNPRPAFGIDPAGRRAHHRRREEGLCGAWPRQSCRRGQRRDLRGREIRPGRSACVATRLHARPEDDHQHQRRFQRHHLHRRRKRRADPVGHRRRAAMGRCRFPELRRRPKSSNSNREENNEEISCNRLRGVHRSGPDGFPRLGAGG